MTENEVLATVFELGISSEKEKASIAMSLKSLGRQTMNVRAMPDAKFLTLKTSHGDFIGWAGLDISFDRYFPELFSLYLVPEYRKYSLGLLLETARATYLLSQNINEAYVRMTKDEVAADLMLKRLGSHFYTLLDSATLDPNYKNLCHLCELYQKECPEQVYLKFDAAHFVEQSVREIGPVDLRGLPKQFRLLRNFSGEKTKVSGAENEEFHVWRSHRPLWLKL